MKRIGMMLDCSRNAVKTVEEIKHIIDVLKKCNYNQILLYIEDTFELDGERYGVKIEYVIGIIGIQDITQLPGTPKYVKGLINLRGKIIPSLSKYPYTGIRHSIFLFIYI